MQQMKKYIFIIGLSLLWLFILLYPFIMGFLFCSRADYKCFSGEQFMGAPLLAHWFGGHYALTENIVYFLDDLARVHHSLTLERKGIVLVLLLSVLMGVATYWLIKKIVHWYVATGARRH